MHARTAFIVAVIFSGCLFLLGTGESDEKEAAKKHAEKDPKLEKLIAQLFTEKDVDKRIKAIDAIAESGGDSPRAVEALLKALKEASGKNDEYIRTNILHALAKLKNPIAVEPLIEFLKNPPEQDSSREMYWCCQAITTVGTTGVKRLTALFHEIKMPDTAKLDRREYKEAMRKNENIKKEIIRGLRYANDRSCIPLFIESLGNESPEVRYEALQALRSTSSPKAIPALIKALGHKDGETRDLGSHALGDVLNKYRLAAIIRYIDKDEKKEHLDLAIEILKDYTGQDFGKDTKKWAEWWEKNGKDFVIEGCADAITAIIERMELEKDEKIKYQLSEILRNNTEVDFATNGAKWREWWEKKRDKFEKQAKVKRTADFDEKDPILEHWIAQLFLEKDIAQRIQAINAIAACGGDDPRAMQALLKALKEAISRDNNELNDGDIRTSIFKALAKMKNPQAVEPLIEFLKNPPQHVSIIEADACINALVAIGAPAVKELISLFHELKMPDPAKMDRREFKNTCRKNENIKKEIIDSLGDTHDMAYIPLFIEALGDEFLKVRRESAEALAKVASKKAVPALIKALGDEEPVVRDRVINALGRVLDKTHLARCIAMLNDDRKREYRDKALEMLKDYTGQDFGEDTKKWTEWWEKNGKNFIIEGYTDAVTAMLARFEDEKDGKIKSEIFNALKKITGADCGEDEAKWREWWAKNRDKAPKTGKWQDHDNKTSVNESKKAAK